MDNVHTWKRVVLVTYAALLLLAGAVSFERARTFKFDFDHFFLDAQHVWLHGELNPNLETPGHGESRRLAFYLPVVPLVMSPMAEGGGRFAPVIWTSMHLLAFGYVCRMLLRRFSHAASPETLGAAFVVTALLMAVCVFEAAKFNQLSFVVLALLVAAIVAESDRKSVKAGVFFALATVLKLLPGVFLIWLVLKRSWVTLAACVVTMVLVTAVPTVVKWGPTKALDYHKEWFELNVAGVIGGGMEEVATKSHFQDYRNQSIREVVGRILPPDSSKPAAFVLTAGLFGGLVWVTRRARKHLSAEKLQIETATFLLAMLVFSPLLRTYYFVWALPAVFILVQKAMVVEVTRAKRLAQVAVVIWLVGQVGWLLPIARGFGVHLWVMVVVGGLLLACGASGKDDRCV